MEEQSEEAMRELRQMLPLLERVVDQFLHGGTPKNREEFSRLNSSLSRVRELSSHITGSADAFTAWVGHSYIPSGNAKHKQWPVTEDHRTITSSLLLFVKGILENDETETLMDRLKQENFGLKEQLTELRQREAAYLSIIETSKRTATVPLSSESKEILLSSLRRQRLTLLKNLTRLQEVRAQYGLNAPLDILNGIDQTQSELKKIEATIASLEK